MNLSYLTHSSDETIEIGKILGSRFKPGNIVCLEGDLGAGKTTLVKGIAEGFSQTPQDSVVSPTFVYLNIYTDTNAFKKLYHFDLYRLSGIDEFLALGFEEFLYKDGLSCIEWSERIIEILPSTTIVVSMTRLSEESRKITVTNL